MERLDTRHLNELIPLMSAFVTVGAEAMSDISARQSDLQLDAIFDAAMLTSAEGRSEASGKLDVLAALLDKSKHTYDAYVLGLTAKLVQALHKLPVEQQTSSSQDLLEKAQALIREQTQYYQLRRTWMDAVRRLLALFEHNHESMTVEEGELLVATAALQDELNAITAIIDSTATAETALLRSRAERQAALGPLFGITAG